MERGLARTPRRRAFHRRLSRRHHHLGGELRQLHAQVREPMNYRLIGLNHKTAPVEVRELLAIPDSRLPDVVRRLSQFPAVEEDFWNAEGQTCLSGGRRQDE